MASENILVPKERYLRLLSRFNGGQSTSLSHNVASHSETKPSEEVMADDVSDDIDLDKDTSNESIGHENDNDATKIGTSSPRTKDDLKSEPLLPPGERVEEQEPVSKSETKKKKKRGVHHFQRRSQSIYQGENSKYGDIRKKWITL